MLTLQRLTLANFGPFKGEQQIIFPESGVVIVYGENMRGKTTLLNAIRYALFGQVVTRGAHQIRPDQIGNWESAANGVSGFSVSLEFVPESQQYQLTRQWGPRAGASPAQSEQDYAETYFLRRGGDVLNEEQAKSELARIMPERVSRFFLFDGELLQEYEELLRHESETGEKIKAAIERILGVPVLTNARDDLLELHKQAQKQEAAAAQKDQKTRELGTHHAMLIESRTYHEKEAARLHQEMQALRDEKASTEDALRKHERTQALLQERDALEAGIDELERRRLDKEARLRDATRGAWKGMLKSKVALARGEAQSRLGDLSAREAGRAIGAQLVARIAESLEDGVCSTCSRPLDQAPEEALQAALARVQVPEDDPDAEQVRNDLARQIALIDSVEITDRADLVRELSLDLDDIQIERIQKEGRIAEIDEQTRNLDESEIRKLSAASERLSGEIAVMQKGIEAEQLALSEIEDNLRKVQAKLDKIGGADLTNERRRRETAQGLYQLFSNGVEVFRDRLRAEVEQDATEVFLKLTSEPDYAGLVINENYGLTIVHRDGASIPVRSAGAEHIVALSLMAALQRNAPLQGPIIMDSPFGRLDSTHTTKVVEALPAIANQVVLLVYESELDRALAREHLKGHLSHEYHMVRRSARHTELEEYV